MMNERITKIVIDTLGKEGVVNSRAFGHWALSDEELEKFAQSIVQECITEFEKYSTVDYASIKVKEHFGVEP